MRVIVIFIFFNTYPIQVISSTSYDTLIDDKIPSFTSTFFDIKASEGSFFGCISRPESLDTKYPEMR